MPTSNPILETIESLPEVLLAGVSSLTVERAEGEWRLRIRYNLYLTKESSARSTRRWRDSIHSLPDDAAEHVPAWLRAVGEDGRLGTLDVEEFRGHGPPWWLAKARAGPGEERPTRVRGRWEDDR